MMNGKLLEAQRIEQRTRYDLEMMARDGLLFQVIENYSRHLTLRPAGGNAYTLLDSFPKILNRYYRWLTSCNVS